VKLLVQSSQYGFQTSEDCGTLRDTEGHLVAERKSLESALYLL
jgi:hypothetical protein